MVFYPSRYVKVPDENLISWTLHKGKYNREKDIYIDVLDPSRRLTATKAEEYVRRLASGFRKHGVKNGDSILVHSFSDIMYPIVYLGIIGAGASFLGSNPSNTPEELTHFLTLSSARYIIVSPEQLPRILEATRSLSIPIPDSNVFVFDTPHSSSVPEGYRSWQTLLRSSPSWISSRTLSSLFRKCLCFGNSYVKNSDQMTASLFSTSGTTGIPKMAVVTHKAVIARCVASHDPDPKPYTVSRLISLPMFHGMAASASHIDPLRYGYPTYILPRFSVSQFLSAIQEYQITETSMVPTMMSMILRNSEFSNVEVKEKMLSMRLVRCAGAPLDLRLQREFQGLLHENARIVLAWGLTELGSATSFLGGERDETGSVGRLLPNVEAKLLDKDGKEITGEGVPGDVLLRSPSMMDRYLGSDSATTETFADDWLRTGDIAYSEKGKWYLVGRAKDMIKVRGWQVAPLELEHCLMQHPQVREVAVIGIKSSNQDSELPRAYVVRGENSSVTEADLKEFLGSRLAKYKALDGGVAFVDSLPKNTSGKVMRRILRDKISSES